jgi:hypothetical protein
MLKKRLLQFAVFLIAVYAILLIPDQQTTVVNHANEIPFAWNRDSLWQSLEKTFVEARGMDPLMLDSVIQQLYMESEKQLHALQQEQVDPTDSGWSVLLQNFFLLSAHAAAQKNPSLVESIYTRLRNEVKQKSRVWNMDSRDARNTVYELLYGMRAAAEETALQSDSLSSKILTGTAEPSETLATKIFDIRIHSGDLLVSRGGAEVSALISRGNDYPGNFSHVALIYIDEKTLEPLLIEAHIEKGVTISTVQQYVQDKKLRFMVLRPRSDLQELVRDPMIPQKAAKMAYDEALKRHIPYDFKMDFYDSSAMFCSEVGSYAYKKNGVQLWTPVSTISSQGIVNWLNTFGVENFVTQMPSDLEYDPKLSVVAEWRDPETLFQDHVDNAVMDALIERADQGEEIKYSIWMLPVARIIKGYGMIQNYFGIPSVIPEGMSATRALKNNSFVERYQTVKQRTLEAIRTFEREQGYTPPYWQLVELARSTVTATN